MTTQREVLYFNRNPPSSSTSSLSFSPSSSSSSSSSSPPSSSSSSSSSSRAASASSSASHSPCSSSSSAHYPPHHCGVSSKLLVVSSLLHSVEQPYVRFLRDSKPSAKRATWILGYPQNQPVKGDSLHPPKNEHAPRKRSFQKESSLLLFQGYVSFRRSIAFCFLKRLKQALFDKSIWEWNTIKKDWFKWSQHVMINLQTVMFLNTGEYICGRFAMVQE